jgi:hypothetical protein
MAEKPVTHICLVNEYPTSILSPIIDPKIPSNKLIIVSAKEFTQQSKLIIHVAKTRGYQAEHKILPSTCCTTELKKAFLNIFENELNQNKNIWLNATNGTRYQALAAYEVARSFSAPVYVVDPNNDSLQWLHPEDRSPTPIENKLKLHEYFSINGSSLVSQQSKHGISSRIRKLGAKWASQSKVIGASLARLNYLAYSAQSESLLSKPMDSHSLRDEHLLALVEELAQENMLVLQSDNRLRFSNPEARFFCNGGWLEEYVFGLIRDIRSQFSSIQDDAHSAEIERLVDGRKVKNEIDVMALVNNKLHIIECKTKRMKAGAGTDTLYKLDSLNELFGGLAGKAALVTFHRISDSDKARAFELDITIFGPDKLLDLRGHLELWLKDS